MTFRVWILFSLLTSMVAPAEVLPNYFGLSAPGAKPEVFSPPIFSQLGKREATNPEMSPNYQHFLFTRF